MAADDFDDISVINTSDIRARMTAIQSKGDSTSPGDIKDGFRLLLAQYADNIAGMFHHRPRVTIIVRKNHNAADAADAAVANAVAGVADAVVCTDDDMAEVVAVLQQYMDRKRKGD